MKMESQYQHEIVRVVIIFLERIVITSGKILLNNQVDFVPIGGLI